METTINSQHKSPVYSSSKQSTTAFKRNQRVSTTPKQLRTAQKLPLVIAGMDPPTISLETTQTATKTTIRALSVSPDPPHVASLALCCRTHHHQPWHQLCRISLLSMPPHAQRKPTSNHRDSQPSHRSVGLCSSCVMEKGKEHASPITPSTTNPSRNPSTQVIPRPFYTYLSTPPSTNASINPTTQVIPMSFYLDFSSYMHGSHAPMPHAWLPPFLHRLDGNPFHGLVRPTTKKATQKGKRKQRHGRDIEIVDTCRNLFEQTVVGTQESVPVKQPQNTRGVGI